MPVMTTDSGSTTIPLHLVDLRPTLSGAEMAAVLVPPRQFDTASFDSYRPDRDYPSQGETLHKVRDFAKMSGHSLRAGFVTSAAESRASISRIMEVTRHRDPRTVEMYVRRADRFNDHAGDGFL